MIYIFRRLMKEIFIEKLSCVTKASETAMNYELPGLQLSIYPPFIVVRRKKKHLNVLLGSLDYIHNLKLPC